MLTVNSVTIADIIKSELARRGLTQTEFAAALGVSRQTVTNWLARKPIKKAHLESIAAELGYEYSDLAAIQAGIRPSGGIRSDRAKRIAKRLEGMPDAVQMAFEGLVEAVQAAINPRYRDWEAQQRKRSQKPTKAKP